MWLHQVISLPPPNPVIDDRRTWDRIENKERDKKSTYTNEHSIEKERDGLRIILGSLNFSLIREPSNARYNHYVILYNSEDNSYHCDD